MLLLGSCAACSAAFDYLTEEINAEDCGSSTARRLWEVSDNSPAGDRHIRRASIGLYLDRRRRTLPRAVLEYRSGYSCGGRRIVNAHRSRCTTVLQVETVCRTRRPDADVAVTIYIQYRPKCSLQFIFTSRPVASNNVSNHRPFLLDISNPARIHIEPLEKMINHPLFQIDTISLIANTSVITFADKLSPAAPSPYIPALLILKE